MSGIDWIPLESVEQLQAIRSESETAPVVIFKHSSRCSTSHMVLSRIERSSLLIGARMYFLDLLRNRTISDLVEQVFDVRHESPQLLIIRGREAILNLSHFEIDPDVVGRSLAKS